MILNPWRPLSATASLATVIAQLNDSLAPRTSLWRQAVGFPIRTSPTTANAGILGGNDHTILADATAGAVTVTLPIASQFFGGRYNVVKVDASANAVTVAPSGTDTISGSATRVLSVQWSSGLFQSDGVNKWVRLADGFGTGGTIVVSGGTLNDTLRFDGTNWVNSHLVTNAVIGAGAYLTVVGDSGVAYRGGLLLNNTTSATRHWKQTATFTGAPGTSSTYRAGWVTDADKETFLHGGGAGSVEVGPDGTVHLFGAVGGSADALQVSGSVGLTGSALWYSASTLRWGVGLSGAGGLQVQSKAGAANTHIFFLDSGNNVRASLDTLDGTTVLGTDPAGAELLRVGGAAELSSFGTVTYPTPGTGKTGVALYFKQPTTASDSSGLGWGGQSATANTVQAALFVQSDGGFGTKMYFATTDSYAAGAKARWQISHLGHFLAQTDASYDIGASGATRPRALYLSGDANIKELLYVWPAAHAVGFLKDDGAGNLSWTAGGAGTSVSTGTTTVDFGAFPGSAYTSVAVTGQAGIVAGSTVWVWVNPVASASHSADEHLVSPPRLAHGNIVAGTGFTIHAFSDELNFQEQVSVPNGYGESSITPLHHGVYNVMWAWF